MKSKDKDGKPLNYHDKNSRTVTMTIMFVVLCGFSFYLGGIFCFEKYRIDTSEVVETVPSSKKVSSSPLQIKPVSFAECGPEYQDYTPCTDPMDGAVRTAIDTGCGEANLGTTTLGILYVSFTIFSIVASSVVRSLGSKTALILGTTGYWLYIAANLKPSWYTMAPAALYLGFAASIIWVGQGTYLTSTARTHAKDYQLHEGTILGNFNGEFWGTFASHQLIGNLISLALLRDRKGGGTSGTTLLFVVFLGSMTLGTILMCFLTRRNSNAEEESPKASENIYSSLVSLSKLVIVLLYDKRMLLIIPLIAYSGLQQAFVWAEFTKYIVEPALGVSGVGGSMAVYGAFDAICSLAAGRFTSGLSSITMIVLGGLFIQLVVVLWMLLLYSLTSGFLGSLYPLIMAAMLGIGDGVLNTQLSALLGLLFKHDTEGAFAQLKVWQSLSIAVVFFMSPHITLHTMLVVMLAGICISAAAFLYVMLQVERAFSSAI